MIPMQSQQDPRKQRRGIYLLPNLFTTAALFAGFYAIVAAMAGRFEAEVTQACVVTLVPVRSHLADDIALSYDLDSRMTPMEDEEVGKENPPEPYGPEGIDLGEAIVQYLAIALEPYPRAAEAGLERKDWDYNQDDPGQSSGPFAVLQALKSKT